MAVASPGPTPILVVGWTLSAVGAIAIAARLYLRIKILKRPLMVSDYIICFAWIAAIVTNGVNTALANLGALDRSVMMSLNGFYGTDDTPKIVKIYWLYHVPLWTTFYLCNAALIAIYLQIFPEFMTKRRIFLRGTILYIVLAYVASLVILCVCIPENEWQSGVNNSRCNTVYGKKSFLSTWALHDFADCLVFSLPWLLVPNLRLSMSLKIGLYGTFLLGAIDIIICIIRLICVEVSQINDDISFSLIILWNNLECNSGVIIACLPSLRPYLGGSERDRPEPVRCSTGLSRSRRVAQIESHRKSAQARNCIQCGMPPSFPPDLNEAGEQSWGAGGERSEASGDTRLTEWEPV